MSVDVDAAALTIIIFSMVFFFSVFVLYNIPNIAIAGTSEETLSIFAVGDSIGYNIEHEQLSGLDKIIHNDTDIFIFNLEGVLSSDSSFLEGSKYKELCIRYQSNQSIFVSESTFVDYLKLAPITIANLANNHILDCSKEGIQETKKVLKEKDILSVGAGDNLEESCEPLFIKTKAGLRIVFVSYNFEFQQFLAAQANRAGAASLEGCNHDYDEIREQKQADLMIASMHLGFWSSDVSEEQITVVNSLLKSGIDIVIGHSPHMPQAIKKISTEDATGEKLAFFSIGNFIFRPDYIMSPEAHKTIVLKLEINKEYNLMNVTIYPVRIGNDGIPYLEEKENKDIISKIVTTSHEEFDTSINVLDNTGRINVNYSKQDR